MSEKRSTFSYAIPDSAVCFWQTKGVWHAAHRDFRPGDPIGRGSDFETALRMLQVNKLDHQPRPEPRYTDLKLIDELLVALMQAAGVTPADLFHHTSITQAAYLRLRAAWVSGEMPSITAALSQQFEDDL